MALAQAEVQTIPPVKTLACVSLPQSYANSTFQRINNVQLPDKSYITINALMTNLGGGYYNYSFCNTTQNGQYIVNGIGDIDGTNVTWSYDFAVNPLGKTFTNSQAILYMLIFFTSLVLFFISLAFGIYLPLSNSRDEMSGYILYVSNLKYLKMFSLACSYLLVMLLAYFGWMICYGYLDFDFLGTLFNFAFYALVIALLPLFILATYFIIANLIRDSEVAEALQRGLQIE